MKTAVIFRTQERTSFAVKNLVGRAPGQAQDFPTALRVGIAEKIFALIDEPLAVDVDHDAIGIRIAMLVGTLDIRSFRVDQYRVAAAPVTHRLRAEPQRDIEHFT